MSPTLFFPNLKSSPTTIFFTARFLTKISSINVLADILLKFLSNLINNK